MKRLFLFFTVAMLTPTVSMAQADAYNLKAQNLHKKVRKTIEHYYSYDKRSGGFVKKSVYINNYDDDGNLTETYSLFNSSFSSNNTPVKTLYNYNNDGQLISTQDISDYTNKYSFHYEFTYNNDDNLIKREAIYKDGRKSRIVYDYGRRDRLTKKTSYSTNGKLSSETAITHRGDERTEVRTSYNSKDGSMNGTYTTVYDDDKKVSYVSESKWGNTNTTYTYDDNNNILKSIARGKSTTTKTYNYVYDNKDNWIKKHYRSGKFHYFYFREIHFANGDVTGSTDFDRIFINRHGNFANVAVVPLKLWKSKKKNTNSYVNTNNNNSGMPVFSKKFWKYTYANFKGKVTPMSGTVNLRVTDNDRLTEGSNVSVTVAINDGGKEITGRYIVKSYIDLGKGNHFWTLESTNKKVSASLSYYVKPQYIKARNISIHGIFLMKNNQKNQNISLYLE